MKFWKNWLAGAAFAAALVLPAAARAAGTGLIFVSNEKGASITVLNGKTYKRVAVIPTGNLPRGMAFNPAHTLLYVACGDSNEIDIIDVKTLKVVGRITKGVPDVEQVVVDPTDHYLYMTNENNSAASVYDLKKKKIIAFTRVGEDPEMVFLTPGAKRIFITAESTDMVNILAVPSGKLLHTILTDQRPRRFALTPDHKFLWVSCEIAGLVDVIDFKTLKIVHRIRFAPEGFQKDQLSPVGLAILRDGKTGYVALGHADRVAVVNAKTLKVEKYLLTGHRPWMVTLTRNEHRAFVTNGESDDITVLNTKTNRVIRSIPVGRYPYGVIIDD
ncbi:MAG: PQQ-dependent catabolism-associated beta-propeller protein [Acetobacteraceae bacterium]